MKVLRHRRLQLRKHIQYAGINDDEYAEANKDNRHEYPLILVIHLWICLIETILWLTRHHTGTTVSMPNAASTLIVRSTTWLISCPA